MCVSSFAQGGTWFSAYSSSSIDSRQYSISSPLFQIEFHDAPVSVLNDTDLNLIYQKTTNSGVVPTSEFDPFVNMSVVNCFETVEIPGTIIMVFNSHKTMNEVLLRASYYVETYPGIYLSNKEFFSTEPLLAKYYANGKLAVGLDRDDIEITRGNTDKYAGIRGFDIPGNAISKEGKGFNDFLDEWAKDKTVPDNSDPKMKRYWEMEMQFLNFVQELRIRYNGNYTIISAVSNHDFIPTLSHEMLHSLYFNCPKFAKNVDDYVEQQINTKDLKLFNNFGRRYYPEIETDTNLRNNEFLAFMLATGMYEDGKERWGPLVAVMLRHLIPASEQTLIQRQFFDEINNLWEKGWQTEEEWSDLIAQSMDIMASYPTLPKSINITQSDFYKFLVERGTTPIIVK